MSMEKIIESKENCGNYNDEGFVYFYNLYLSAVRELQRMCLYDNKTFKELRDYEAKREKVERFLSKIHLNNPNYIFNPQKYDALMFIAKTIGGESFTKEDFENVPKTKLFILYSKFFKENVEKYLNYKNFLQQEKKITRDQKIGLSNLKNAIIGRYGSIVLAKSPIA